MQAGKSQRSVLALVITCALILGFGIPLIPLVGVDSAEGTEVSAASDVATVSAENSLQNGSFEQPDVYQYRETSDVPYWKSTTTSGNIEIGSVFKNGNGDNDSLHMRTGEKVAAAEGSQFGKPATSNGNDQYAELNSNQASSLYQVVNTVPESKYDWGLYHRGRQGKDAMALVVGPKQNVAPMKTSATSNDQLQQIVTWVSGQQDRDFGLDMVHFSQTGTSRKITVYTTKFASGGRFDTTGVSSPFSWSKDSRHTERWELWIIVSDCDEWYGHGEFNGDEDPDASYIVPEGQNETLLGFVAVSTSTGDITSGNLLDAVQFRQYYRMDFQTPPSGSGTYSTLNGNLAYGNLVDDVSVAAEGGDGGNLVTNGGFESPSLTKDGETGSANAPANAATQRPAPRITPPIGRIASPSQSANKRRLASLTDSAIALPYFVPRKPFEADVGAVRAWESPYATAKLNNR